MYKRRLAAHKHKCIYVYIPITGDCIKNHNQWFFPHIYIIYSFSLVLPILVYESCILPYIPVQYFYANSEMLWSHELLILGSNLFVLENLIPCITSAATLYVQSYRGRAIWLKRYGWTYKLLYNGIVRFGLLVWEDRCI